MNSEVANFKACESSSLFFAVAKVCNTMLLRIVLTKGITASRYLYLTGQEVAHFLHAVNGVVPVRRNNGITISYVFDIISTSLLFLRNGLPTCRQSGDT